MKLWHYPADKLPLSKANAFDQGLTPDVAKALLAEMAAARKNR